MTDEQHNKYLAYSFFAYAGFQVFWLFLIGAWMYLWLSLIQDRPGQPAFPVEFFGPLFAVMAVMQLIFVVPSLIAGYGLLKRKSWGRIAGIVGGVMAAMSVPIGTGVCVYAMWFLLTDKGKNFYDAIALHQPSEPLSMRESSYRPWEEEIGVKDSIKEPRPSDWR